MSHPWRLDPLDVWGQTFRLSPVQLPQPASFSRSKKLEDLLEKSFSLVKMPSLQPVVMCVMKHLPKVKAVGVGMPRAPTAQHPGLGKWSRCQLSCREFSELHARGRDSGKAHPLHWLLPDEPRSDQKLGMRVGVQGPFWEEWFIFSTAASVCRHRCPRSLGLGLRQFLPSLEGGVAGWRGEALSDSLWGRVGS